MKSVKFLITMISIMLSALASQAQQHKTQLLELKKENQCCLSNLRSGRSNGSEWTRAITCIPSLHPAKK